MTLARPAPAATGAEPAGAISRSTGTRWIAWSAILLLTLYLMFVGGGWAGIYVAPLRLVSVALAALALTGWLLVSVRRASWRPYSVLLPAIAACLLSLAVSTFLSRWPRVSLEYLGYALLLASLYLLLVRLLAHPFQRARLGALVVSLCLVISGLYVALVVAHWLDWWTIVGFLTIPPLRPDFEGLTYGNPSAVLTVTMLLLAAAVGHVGTETPRRRSVALGLVALVGTVAILSGSRAGWLAVVAATVLVGGAWLLAGPGRESLASVVPTLRRSARLRLGASVAVVVLVLAGIALAPAVLRRATEGGEGLRVTYVLSALRMFTEAPIAGTGPGTWVVQRVRYTVPPEADFYIPHAHDIYAQTLSELGLLGVAAGVALVVWLAWLVRGAIRDPDPVRRRWGWLAAFALVYFGAHQVLDFYANMPAVLFAAALPVAWLDATATDRPRIAGRALPVAMPRGVVLGGVAVLLIVVVGLESSELQAITHTRAVALADAGDWTAADPLARSAAAADPALPPYHLTEGLTAARAGDHPRAAEAFRRVVAADDLPEAWLDLAAEQAALEDATSAQASLSAALRLGYQRPAVSLAAGDLALRIGSTAVASEAFTDALLASPSLAGDPWWTADPTRAALFPAVRVAAIQRGGPYVGWELALEAGDYIGARSLAERLDPASAAAATRIIGAWSGDAAGFQAVLDQCSEHPLDVTALAWCARVQGHAGNDAEADRYRAWANTIVGSAYAAGAELRVDPNERVGRADAGNAALFYGYYTYRRPTPRDLLVPDLVHLTLE